ncbi:unnamed protein product [Mytilus coruscus]|uniref:Immunoglobulin I-set domain-containing protein n=1 Tax=Mytilus coruscus TaxID=42192 RepID=A0A6J8A9Z1_MYTCO|nr:unnamed protein product [Mytilus coruscus]
MLSGLKQSKLYKHEKIERNKNVYIDSDGKDHVMTIQNAKVTDSGQYIIIAGNVRKQLSVTVEEMPDAVKKMSEHDRSMFLKAAGSGTAVRYYIRIMIVGESGVGKTCLLRRLMNEQIGEVRSTDGINIEVKQCKINRQTQKWIFTSGNLEFRIYFSHWPCQVRPCQFDFALSSAYDLAIRLALLLPNDLAQQPCRRKFLHELSIQSNS